MFFSSYCMHCIQFKSYVYDIVLKAEYHSKIMQIEENVMAQAKCRTFR